jgi:hypothetical protein
VKLIKKTIIKRNTEAGRMQGKRERKQIKHKSNKCTKEQKYLKIDLERVNRL